MSGSEGPPATSFLPPGFAAAGLTPPPLPASPPPRPRTSKPARPRSLGCVNCGAPIAIQASGTSITAACGSCGAVLDVANPDVRLIAGAAERTRTPLIPIGTRGTLQGVEWQAIGYQVRSSGAGAWQWEEWLLWNPYQGFRFLAQDHGHWTLYSMLRRDISDGWVSYASNYKAEEPVVARVDYVLGEFYWRVKVGDEVTVQEFAKPTVILSKEANGTEVTWSRGAYTDAADVQAAFKLREMPPQTGQAPHQPAAKVPGRWWTLAAACVLLVLLQVLNFGSSANRTVLDTTIRPAADDRSRVLSSPLFTLPERGGSVTLDVRAPALGQTYGLTYLTLALVTAAGDSRFDAPVTLSVKNEAYLGSVTLGSVPGGSYKLLVTETSAYGTAVEPGNGGRPMLAYSVTVRRHAPNMEYFWIALVALVAWPIVIPIWNNMRADS